MLARGWWMEQMSIMPVEDKFLSSFVINKAVAASRPDSSKKYESDQTGPHQVAVLVK
jgi:hypothetical protein